LQKLRLLLTRLLIFIINFIFLATVGQVVTYVVLGVFDLFLLLFLFISSALLFGFIYTAYPNFEKLL